MSFLPFLFPTLPAPFLSLLFPISLIRVFSFHLDSTSDTEVIRRGGSVKKSPFLAALMLALCISLLALPSASEAGRLGGSKSFGSKPSYSQRYSAPTPSPSFEQQAPPLTSSRPTGGMFGGLLGGLLMGGLFGSLFFGHHFAGPGLLDILLIGGGLYLLTRFLRNRQTERVTSFQAPRTPSSPGTWDKLRATASAPPPPPQPGPAGFDSREFLAGAKAAYAKLQAAWDRRDLDELRQFTSPEVLSEISRQAETEPFTGKTEILLLEARLLDVRTEGTQTVASVLFEAMLREGSPQAPAEQVREIWHFSRYESGGNTMWVVDGIQQVTA